MATSASTIISVPLPESATTLLRERADASGVAVADLASRLIQDALRSKTSPSGCGALTSSAVVSASRLASIASMSSWLLLAASGAGGGGAGAALGGGAGAGLAAAGAGMSFIAGLEGAGAGAAAGAAAAGLSAGFSAGLASSSAMIRRIDARISSIEGSWTFAGCVISDSRSSRRIFH